MHERANIESYLGLGDLIARLEREDPTRVLPLGFNNPHSYRGDYMDLAFEPVLNISIGDMLAAARSALGATYQGWKGGDYTMGEHSSCWIAEEGDSGDNKIGPLLLELLLANDRIPGSTSDSRGELRARIRAALGTEECGCGECAAMGERYADRVTDLFADVVRDGDQLVAFVGDLPGLYTEVDVP